MLKNQQKIQANECMHWKPNETRLYLKKTQSTAFPVFHVHLQKARSIENGYRRGSSLRLEDHGKLTWSSNHSSTHTSGWLMLQNWKFNQFFLYLLNIILWIKMCFRDWKRLLICHNSIIICCVRIIRMHFPMKFVL